MLAILTEKLLAKLRRKSYREAYVDENVRTGIAYQIRALRDQRGWSQKKLAEVLGKPQSVLSRIEDPDYGKLTVQTLLEVAAAFDVALLVQYVDFGEFIERTRDVSPEAMNASSFSEDQFIPLNTSSRNIPSINIPDHLSVNASVSPDVYSLVIQEGNWVRYDAKYMLDIMARPIVYDQSAVNDVYVDVTRGIIPSPLALSLSKANN